MADARRAPLKDQTDISGARALIVEARFYDDIQDALMEGAVAELKAAGVTHDVLTVPGALEIPAAIAIALDAAESSGKPYDAAIALGCVMRGETIHFEIVSIEILARADGSGGGAETAARQWHHHRQYRCAGLGARARQRVEQGRRRRARGARHAADQAATDKGPMMADNRKPAKGPDRKANRRGAARLAAVQALYQMDIAGAGINDIFAEFESHWLGNEVEGDEYLPAEAAFFRDVVSGVVRDQARLDPADRRCASEGLAAEADRRDPARGAACRLLRTGSTARMCRRRVVVSEYVDVAHAFVEKRRDRHGQRGTGPDRAPVPRRRVHAWLAANPRPARTR